MTLAFRLIQENAEVTLFERDGQLGGLSTHHDYGDFHWDKFYHVIVPTDGSLINLVKDLGLEEELQWSRSLTGYYTGESFYPLNSPMEFLMFPLLNLWDKFRLAFTIFFGGKIDDWQKLEQTTVENWLIRMGGRKNFNKFWKPLLLAKLGENYQRVSAVFIWTYIRRLFKSREHPVEKDFMGYVAGGYKTVFDRISQEIEARGSKVLLNREIQSIEENPDGGILVRHENNVEHFDKIIFTAPLNVLQKVCSGQLFTIERKGDQVEYLGVVCMVLVTKTPINPYYVLNIGDTNSPFTGVIGISSLVDQKYTAGHYITYFPKYIPSDHSYWEKTDDDIQEIFMNGVKKLYPNLDSEDIISIHINRALKVQPLQVLGYSSKVPKIHTNNPDFFILNTSQFVNDSVNNNAVVAHVDSFVKEFNNAISNKKISH